MPSTRIGIYAIFLITAFYGTLLITNQQGKTAPNAVEIIQKRTAFPEEKEITAIRDYYLGKNHTIHALYLVSLKLTLDTPATAITEPGFFTHSATIKHYISTI